MKRNIFFVVAWVQYYFEDMDGICTSHIYTYIQHWNEMLWLPIHHLIVNYYKAFLWTKDNGLLNFWGSKKKRNSKIFCFVQLFFCSTFFLHFMLKRIEWNEIKELYLLVDHTRLKVKRITKKIQINRDLISAKLHTCTYTLCIFNNRLIKLE